MDIRISMAELHSHMLFELRCQGQPEELKIMWKFNAQSKKKIIIYHQRHHLDVYYSLLKLINLWECDAKEKILGAWIMKMFVAHTIRN